MGHGSGGKMTHDLIAQAFLPAFDNPALRAGDDGAVIDLGVAERLAISTDSHVVWPLFFPGGDIGRLAVCGTVNDVAMMGADPRYLTAGFVLEEGLSFEVLEKVIDSMRLASAEAGIQIVAGDTKVVQKGKGDGLYINTTGVGVLPAGRELSGRNARAGDVVILSGPVGDHGIAVLCARGELGLQSEVRSDVAPLNSLTKAMLDTGAEIHVLRDPTRGGLATTLNEIAVQSQIGIKIREAAVPVRPAVAAACELLGFDPLYVANEGKLIGLVAAKDAQTVLAAMRQTRYGAEAVVIGEVVREPIARVLMETSIGSHRILDVLSGEMLPRIC
ncbi:MAG: hydrogenase expression/formation protein HypE [Anaerolineales bacterium]|jgi:hydrogenase expression/formation protein HypE